MYFTEIEIENYKCFKEAVSLKLAKGINVVVGQNNVGKTSLLEALGLRQGGSPHISYENFKQFDILPPSRFTFSFNITKDEILTILRKTGDIELKFPLEIEPNFDSDFRKLANEAYGRGKIKDYFSADDFDIKLTWLGNNKLEFHPKVPDDAYLKPPILKATSHDGHIEFQMKFRAAYNLDNFQFYGVTQVDVGDNGLYRDDFILHLGRPLKNFIYRFRAERIPFQPCTLGINKELSSDGANLAEVLHLLIPKELETFNKLVRTVLPNIYQAGILKTEENQGQVRIWNNNRNADYPELGFTLDKCGSGVGQVLAIIYILMTKEPRVLLIDEPQSFLHPGAARKLIEVIKDYGKHHQVVISTHSPTIITAASPDTVTLVKQCDTYSVAEQIDVREMESQLACFRELGVSFSDVFGYDRILWVEGPTEEKCFPLIIRKFFNISHLGTAILAIEQTGSVDQKNKQKIEQTLKMHGRLTETSNGLLPPIVDFILDRENRGQKKIEDLTRTGRSIHGRDCIYFLDKRTYENYLLLPEAITETINELDLERENPLTLDEVSDWIELNKGENEYYNGGEFAYNEKNWHENINGAKFLAELFGEKTNHRISYSKTTHSVLLTEKILKISQENFSDIRNILTKIFV